MPEPTVFDVWVDEANNNSLVVVGRKHENVKYEFINGQNVWNMTVYKFTQRFTYKKTLSVERTA